MSPNKHTPRIAATLMGLQYRYVHLAAYPLLPNVVEVDNDEVVSNGILRYYVQSPTDCGTV